MSASDISKSFTEMSNYPKIVPREIEITRRVIRRSFAVLKIWLHSKMFYTLQKIFFPDDQTDRRSPMKSGSSNPTQNFHRHKR